LSYAGLPLSRTGENQLI